MFCHLASACLFVKNANFHDGKQGGNPEELVGNTAKKVTSEAKDNYFYTWMSQEVRIKG